MKNKQLIIGYKLCHSHWTLSQPSLKKPCLCLWTYSSTCVWKLIDHHPHGWCTICFISPCKASFLLSSLSNQLTTYIVHVGEQTAILFHACYMYISHSHFQFTCAPANTYLTLLVTCVASCLLCNLCNITCVCTCICW